VLAKVYEKHVEITKEQVEPAALRQTALLKVADEMGEEILRVRGAALRASAELDPEAVDLDSVEFQEPHRRGEVLVAALLRSFVSIWSSRLKTLNKTRRRIVKQRVVGSKLGFDERFWFNPPELRNLTVFPFLLIGNRSTCRTRQGKTKQAC